MPLKRYLAVVSIACLGFLGCPSTDTDSSESGEASGEGSAAAPVHEAAETAGLVGPGMGDTEAIEVTDPRPDAPSILFTAGLKGYTEPCGCTLDILLGGIDRVTGFVERSSELAESALVLDAGNLLFEYAHIEDTSLEQERRKARVLTAALREMGTAATTPGPTDFAAGVAFYRELLGETDVQVLSANLTDDTGARLGSPWAYLELGEQEVAVIGAASSSAFTDVDGVLVTPARAAIDSALEEILADEVAEVAVVLLFQGDVTAARTELEDIEGIDFVILGAPRETDEIESVGSAFTLEAFDQGRYVGRLKLVTGSEATETAAWQNARVGSAGEAERIRGLISSIEDRLASMPEYAEGEEPPIVQTQRDRLASLEAELAAMTSDAPPEFPSDARSFYFESVAMAPGYPTNDTITAEMIAYNEALAVINLASASPPESAAEGMPHYVGEAQCAQCHVEEHEWWVTTQHATAIQTLQDRNKEYDRSCIGCHVTGYEMPGGSALGHSDGLENVQCETCHGPGSMHVANPTLVNVPTGVQTAPSEATCTGCHNDEHSPSFNWTSYREEMLAPGHGLEM